MNRPYPWRCASCGTKAIQPAVIEHRSQVKHENSLHEVYIAALPVHQCMKCGIVLMGDDVDEIIRARLRDQLKLLKPSIIVACRKALAVTQGALADLCGFASESVCRWENGGVQSRSSDRLMRLFFGVPQVREFLMNLPTMPTLGEQVVWSVGDVEDYATRCLEYTPDAPQRGGPFGAFARNDRATTEPLAGGLSERNKDPPRSVPPSIPIPDLCTNTINSA